MKLTKTKLKEIIKEEKMKLNEGNEHQNFIKFAKELATLSLKYGVAIQSVGGVKIGDLKKIRYDADWTSGDLLYKAQWNNS